MMSKCRFVNNLAMLAPVNFAPVGYVEIFFFCIIAANGLVAFGSGAGAFTYWFNSGLQR